MERKTFTLTEADIRLLNSIPDNSDFTAIWAVLAEKHGFDVNTVEGDVDESPQISAVPK